MGNPATLKNGNVMPNSAYIGDDITQPRIFCIYHASVNTMFAMLGRSHKQNSPYAHDPFKAGDAV